MKRLRVRVKCPKCGFQRITETRDIVKARTKCFKCGKTFRIMGNDICVEVIL